MRKLSRRKFLETGVFGSIAMAGANAARPLPAYGEGRTQNQNFSATGATGAFNERERDVLRVVMDEIIPAANGMPAASQVGGVGYVEQLAGRDPKVAKELLGGLAALENLSQKRSQTSFQFLSREQRVDMLAVLERQDVESFKALRDTVYEAYYEQPQVWKLIGYQFYPTNGMGLIPGPFDEQILAEVVKKPRFYREV